MGVNPEGGDMMEGKNWEREVRRWREKEGEREGGGGQGEEM